MKSVAVKQTKDQVADIIRADILSGALKGGDELTQEQVAEQTALSRMPVREAFQTLEQEGFLIRLPNRHMRVIHITKENIMQYFSSLAALELSFCMQLLENKEKVAILEALIEKELKNNSSLGEFGIHEALSSLLDNEYLTHMHKKWLNSFYLHAVKKYFNPNAVTGCLITILEGMQNSNQMTISKGLQYYFKYYEHLFIKDGELA